MKTNVRFLFLGLLYFLTTLCANAQVKSAFGWYRVTESSNEEIWNVGSNFQLLSVNPTSITDSILFTGFSNEGVSAIGTLKGNQIKMEWQTREHFPMNGAGRSWTVSLSASGEFDKGGITLSFTFQHHGLPKEEGTIKAEYYLPQYANQTNVNDTVIKGKWYQYALYDLNRHANFIGEMYTGNIKNGHWLFFDHHGMLYQSSQFLNDTLNGISEFYTNSEYYQKPRYKQVGLMVNGKKVGEFSTFEYQGKRWKKIGYDMHDASGQRIFHMQLYPSGKPLYQTFYSPEGKEIWYRGFYENGKLYKDDNVKEEYYIEL